MDSSSIALIISLFIIVMAVLYISRQEEKSKTVMDAWFDANSQIMTVAYENGVMRLYKGECTVWHHYPMMERCGTDTESRLSELWTYIQEHGNPYPTAHLKKDKQAN